MHTTKIAFAIAFTLAQATAAHAGKVVVAAYGLDAPGCGTKRAPCRSIGRAIADAAPGDTIAVGPGRYGEFDGDDSPAAGPGEETVTAGVLVRIAKPLRIVSRDGSGVTVIDAGGSPRVQAAVLIESDDVVFGKRKHGFTVTGADVGISVRDTVHDVHLEANWARDNGVGLFVAGQRVTVAGNHAVANDGTGFLIHTTESSFVGNVAIANTLGFFVAGSGNTLADNVASANDPSGAFAGMAIRGRAILEGNVVSGNHGTGIGIQPDGSGTRLVGNRIVGNTGIGIAVGSGASVDDLVISRNDIFGNNTLRSPEGTENCGLLNATGAPLAAPENYWGAPDGPGPDPADAACRDAVLTEPVAGKSLRVRTKAAR
jgi:parallel beta-helix repeat protein